MAQSKLLAHVSKKRQRLDRDNHVSQVAFSFYVIALAAKLARCDGVANYQERQSLMQVFAMPASQSSKISTLFEEALSDGVSALHYAKQLVVHFPNKKVLAQVIDSLFAFAGVDGPINHNEMVFLKEVMLAFGYKEPDFEVFLRKHVVPVYHDPFEALGVGKSVGLGELKNAYRAAIKDCHPDRVQAGVMLPEMKHLLRERFEFFTQAFDYIRKKNKLG